jgi:hypothetical protein
MGSTAPLGERHDAANFEPGTHLVFSSNGALKFPIQPVTSELVKKSLPRKAAHGTGRPMPEVLSGTFRIFD